MPGVHGAQDDQQAGQGRKRSAAEEARAHNVF
jgi:hypothetical protein